MAYTDILSGVNTILNNVSGIANVYDYFRLEVSQTDQISRFVSDSILHIWMITRVECLAETLTNYEVKRQHYFDIWGYYAVDDDNASEKTFQGVCENIMDNFDDLDNLAIHTNCRTIQPTQLLEVTHVKWCNVLCHRAHLRIAIEEERSMKFQINATFENDLEGFTILLSPDTAERSNIRAYKGLYSVHIIESGSTLAGLQKSFDVIVDKYYKISGHIYVVSGSVADVEIGIGNDKVGFSDIELMPTTTGEWNYVSTDLTQAGDSGSSILCLLCRNNANAYFDNVKIEEYY